LRDQHNYANIRVEEGTVQEDIGEK